MLGVDTESDSMYHYQEKVCLLQLTDAHGDVIVDPLKVRDLSALAPVFADRSVVKVFHGSDYDVVSLKRDFGFEFHNLFDTLIAAQLLGLDRLGLADLIGRYFGIDLDKKYQRHDWSLRPLLEDHIDYARGDTHWLPALREILLHHLRKLDRVEHHEEECVLLESREWQRRTFDPNGWTRVKGCSGLDETGKRILRRLYQYRDEQARSLDRPSYKVLADALLIEIAERRPRTHAALEALFPNMRAMRRRHDDNILEAVLLGMSDPDPAVAVREEPADDDEEPKGPARLTGRVAERVYEVLKEWRNGLVSRSPLHNTFSVANNSTLKNIARARPYDLDELAAVPEVRRWQVRDHGRTIL
ncbi:MAG TPA: HRDC domain-containing protein, partial [Myxococcota bacterium]|nr:HRDC domain-containing protein [Myxococcota bacterium]